MGIMIETMPTPPHMNQGRECSENSENKSYNFLIRVLELVNRMSEQMNQLSEKNRTERKELKNNYKNLTQQSADSQRSLGNAGLVISSIGFLLMMGQFGFKVQSDRDVMKFLSEQTPQLGGMFTSRLQASQQEKGALAQLDLSEINHIISKMQSESEGKGKLDQLFQNAAEVLKRASSQN